MEDSKLLNLTASITAAHVAHNPVAVSDMVDLVQGVHRALLQLTSPIVENAPEIKRALVSVRASIKPDYLICMECGARLKMLKKHLKIEHGMTPADYRTYYDLPRDYPMAAPKYSQQRGDMARAHGFGRNRDEPIEPAADEQKSQAQNIEVSLFENGIE